MGPSCLVSMVQAPSGGVMVKGALFLAHFGPLKCRSTLRNGSKNIVESTSGRNNAVLNLTLCLTGQDFCMDFSHIFSPYEIVADK